MIKKNIRDVIIYTLISGISGAISFLLLPILTTFLSPADYGILSIYNATVRFLALIIPFGMTHVILVDLVKNKAKFKEGMAVFMRLSVIATIVLTTITLFFSFFEGSFFGLSYSYLLSIPLLALLLVYFELFSTVFVYLQKVKVYAGITLGKYGVETLLTIFLIVFVGMDWVGRIVALCISILLILPVCIRLLNKNMLLPSLARVMHAPNVSNLLKKGGPLIFMSLAILLVNLSDRFFIESMVSIEETGMYSVASSIAALMLLLITALLKVIRPQLYHTLNEEIVKKSLIRKTIIYYHLLILIVAIVFISLLPILYKFLINESYGSSLSYCWILILSFFFWGGYSFFISFAIHKGKNKINGIISAFAICINLVLNAVFINYYGTKGAAFATVVTYFFMFVSSFLIYLYLNETTYKQNS